MALVDSEFRVGDFVSLACDMGKFSFRLVVDLQPNIEEIPDALGVLYLLDAGASKGSNKVYGPKNEYAKVGPTIELISSAKIRAEQEHLLNKIDNLTYIEICARLKEHEHSIV